MSAIANMAGQARGPVFVSVSIYDSTCQRTLLDWTIADVVDERVTVDAFYKMALALCDPTVRSSAYKSEQGQGHAQTHRQYRYIF